MSREGLFYTIFPLFADSLERQRTAADNFRWVARNFLLDENVLEPRALTYGGYGAADGFADRSDWVDAHKEYLGEEVLSERPTNGPPRTLDPANRRRCPETFRHDDNFIGYGSAPRPCREILQAGHLYRVGVVKKPVPTDLLPARKTHLPALRDMAGRDDYAATTDPEV